MKKRMLSLALTLAVAVVLVLILSIHAPAALAAGQAWSDPPVVKMVSGGTSSTFAIKTDGSLWAWGHNGHGQLGDGTTTHKFEPVRIKPDTRFASVSASSGHSLAIDENGGLWAWGSNEYGQLGDGTFEDKTLPVRIKNDTRFANVSAGREHSLAIDENTAAFGRGELIGRVSLEMVPGRTEPCP
jgi:alpha-tubulin suppressor-like RCC1 family protein